MTQRKKLIEVALPLEAINAASAREKSVRHGHPSTLHLWWARRPLAAARAVIFTSLVDDPDSEHAPPKFVEACKQLPKGNNAKGDDTPRMRLFDFIERLVTWEATTDEAILEQARDLIRLSTDDNPPPLLDPFAGGGSIPLEAQRLGLEAHASDLNPVAVMINKAQIEIPPRFADMPPVNPRDRENDTGGDATWKGAAGLAADVRYYGEWMRDKAYEKIGHLYPEMNGETVVAWLWARTVESPNPAVNAHVPLVRSFRLSKKKGRARWAKPIIEGDTIRFEITQGKPPKGKDGTINRGNGICIVSGEPIPGNYIRNESYEGRMGAMLMAIVTEGDRQRNYYSPTVEQTQIAESAQPAWKPTQEMNRDTPDLVSGRGYGFFEWGDLFTPRQLVALTTFSDLVQEARQQAYQDALSAGLPDDDVPLRDSGRGALAYGEAVSVYLAFVIDKCTDYWTTIATWMTRETVGHAFSKQALPMTWDYPEANPFADFHCAWHEAFKWVAKALEHSTIKGTGIAQQIDASTIKQNQIIVSTDPPYYDNISYADLSDFFYVWMRKGLRDVYSEIFGSMLVPKEAELIASAHRHGGNKEAEAHFEQGMFATFQNIRRLTLPEYPLTVYYAFKQQDTEILESGAQVASTGWETMLSSLIDSGFSVDGTWPMRTERSARSVAQGTNALASSIVLVCRPRPEDAPQISRREFVSLLRQELPQALEEMQSGNIAPVDLAQASIGPGMAVYSRYSQVLEADGTPLTVRTALQIINQELDAYLSQAEGHVDADSRFAVAWFDQNGFDEGAFGQADVLARAKNTSVSGIEDAHIIESGRGKVRLLAVHELYEMNPDWDPADDKRATTWEAVHHLIARLQRYGEQGAAMLMLKMDSEMAAEARQLAYRLYSICERKGWADHARDYNALVVQWSDIQSEVSTQREALARGDATRQTSMFDDE